LGIGGKNAFFQNVATRSQEIHFDTGRSGYSQQEQRQERFLADVGDRLCEQYWGGSCSEQRKKADGVTHKWIEANPNDMIAIITQQNEVGRK